MQLWVTNLHLECQSLSIVRLDVGGLNFWAASSASKSFGASFFNFFGADAGLDDLKDTVFEASTSCWYFVMSAIRSSVAPSSNRSDATSAMICGVYTVSKSGFV